MESRYGILGAAALLLWADYAVAQSAPEVRLPPDDVQAVYETILFRGCQRQVIPLLQNFERDMPTLKAERETQDRICGCTVRLATQGSRMKAVFELPPEKLKNLAADPEVMEYVKAKTVVSLLQCAGHAFDQILDPKPRP